MSGGEMHRLSFAQVCGLATFLGALVAGAAAAVLGHWVYDEAGA